MVMGNQAEYGLFVSKHIWAVNLYSLHAEEVVHVETYIIYICIIWSLVTHVSGVHDIMRNGR